MTSLEELEKIFSEIQETEKKARELKQEIFRTLDAMTLEIYFRLKDMGVEDFTVEYGDYEFDFSNASFRKKGDKEFRSIVSDLEVLRYFITNFNDIVEKKLSEVKVWLEEQLNDSRNEYEKLKQAYNLVVSLTRH